MARLGLSPWFGGLLALLLSACDGADQASTPSASSEPAATPSDPSPAEEAALEEAASAAATLGRTLKTRLLAAMAEGGPAAAVSLCANEAETLTEGVSRDTRAQLGRSSLRLRNPDNAGPDWVRARLEQLGERSAEGVAPVREVVDDNGRRLARFAGPIAIEGPCLTCHGPQDGIPADVKTVLAERYPADRAHGYREGDLRGLIWAEVPIATAR